MEKKKIKITYFARTDWLIWIPCIVLSALSIILLAGILESGYSGILGLGRRNLMTQSVAVGLGILFAFILSKIDYRIMTEGWKIFVPLFYLLLLATFVIGVGTPERPDAKRWIYLSFIRMSIQPSEFLKLAFILIFAYHIQHVQEEMNRVRNLIGLIAHGLLPVMLVQIQGDSGTALLFGLIFISMLFAAGIAWKYVAAFVVAVAALAPAAWFFVLGEFQRSRIIALINQSEQDALGYFYQQNRAQIAIGSGKMWGNGIFSDSHTYVPSMQNDFIFAFIGDSLGFAGCIAIISVICIFCLKILFNCTMAADKQGKLICVGVFAMIFFQSAVNIGMCLSLLPVIGNSLPFLSSGGSSLLANYMAIGLALSVYMTSKKKKAAPLL